MAALPREGYRDLHRRLRMAWLWSLRLRVRRETYRTETELGLLAWEQVDFYDEITLAEVRKIEEFERTQAELHNTSAELAARQEALDEELAREKAAHDQTQAALAAERAPLAAQLQEQEAARRQKLEAVGRFERAIAEITAMEKKLENDSLGFMNIERPGIEVRIKARQTSEELARLFGEKKHVLADKERASEQAAAFESGIATLRAELQRIDASVSAARESLAAATRRITGEKRLADRQKKKSTIQMSDLDRKKRRPYRFIGACLADHGIAPANQPEVLEKVIGLREENLRLTEALSELQAQCAGADPRILIAFYLLLAAILAAICAMATHRL